MPVAPSSASATLPSALRRLPCRRSGSPTPEVQALIDDMVETMREAHGVGLAAPQVGEEIQLFVYSGRQGPPEIPLHVVINP